MMIHEIRSKLDVGTDSVLCNPLNLFPEFVVSNRTHPKRWAVLRTGIPLSPAGRMGSARKLVSGVVVRTGTV